jgi:uncharacterized cupin superfamily protein
VLHAHANEDEAWHVPKGDVRFMLDAETRSAPTGSFVFAPRGTQYCFQNAGAQPQSWLCSPPASQLALGDRRISMATSRRMRRNAGDASEPSVARTAVAGLPRR